MKLYGNYNGGITDITATFIAHPIGNNDNNACDGFLLESKLTETGHIHERDFLSKRS